MQRGTVPLSGVSECGLPRELWELIFALVDTTTLCIYVPLVSVFFHKQSFPNAALWRRKCQAVYGPAVVKPALLTWKQHYFAAADLFPYRGITLGVTTYAQLMTVPGAVTKLLEASKYVVIDDMSFWVYNDVCCSVNLSQRIPRRWALKGLTYGQSFNQYKALFTRWTGNYRVNERPRIKQLKKHKVQWSAELCTVGKSDLNTYYEIALRFFSINGGSEDRTDLLSSISITAPKDHATLEQTYNARQLVD
eukprot:TRINITY_DN5820_c0_g1_i1.p1 TRINITY_DN5820_c0_g1~~TRINITY_DN5820_c0_g1_i1.p1  ORF type:complete len:250 (-),score=41.24 TRINITY_DN5820_c0_g1_i1:76-825(-)